MAILGGTVAFRHYYIKLLNSYQQCFGPVEVRRAVI